MSLVIAAGGTGGHVFPALAVAQVWRDRWPTVPVFWMGVRAGKERRWVEAAGFPFHGLRSGGWQPSLGWRNLRLAYRLPIAAVETSFLFSRLRPRVVFTTGGYPGLLPGFWARLYRIPLVVLELNRYAGRTVRWLSRWATEVYGAFSQVEGISPSVSFRWMGVPVRFSSEDRSRYTSATAKAYWGFPVESPVVLVLGGSQGSSALNRAVEQMVDAWIEAGLSVLWQVGGREEEIRSRSIRRIAFIEDMAAAYTAADVVVSRAGGSTLGELAWWGKASILVPSPYVAEDHQRKNALYWEERGAAIVVSEEEGETLREAVIRLAKDASLRRQYEEAARNLCRTEAAKAIAEALYQIGYGST
ncbi:MAG: UDP-N-acetylglucosamine--N-acetylmuramyl-(pentapeptide) pyrophosphoryl-undecaprenol N-acetylglucosamine transferase [Bacteroidia bacterium]|nr:UDP-N-acetylglucosamine--N-acetylmuramyl-(pentapeptide) pyrophosphoryl-undecaprenol N-acetylglucosamine transferase [Bacteroidia bacterium]